MNLRIAFKFKDCKLQFYEKRRLFSYFSMNPRTPASRWRRLLKLKRRKINFFKIIIGLFFTPPLFLATKVAISFVYCSPKTIKCTQKPKIEKKFTGIDQSSERASECHSPHHIYNSLLRMRAIHELKMILTMTMVMKMTMARAMMTIAMTMMMTTMTVARTTMTMAMTTTTMAMMMMMILMLMMMMMIIVVTLNDDK